MDNIPESASGLAWLWVIEALASYRDIDISLLHDVVESAPELPDVKGKDARERVALRCLESLFGPRNGINRNLAPTQVSQVRLDPSESCEDVLQRVLFETSVSDARKAGPAMSKWDVTTYITQKRASMPKCTLQQLKDTILDGSHPYADFLKDKSGLAYTNKSERPLVNYGNWKDLIRMISGNCSDAQTKHKSANQNENNTPTPVVLENGRRLSEEDPANDGLLPSKRDRTDSATSDMIGQCRENHNGSNDCDDVHRIAKKIKRCAAFALQSEKQNLVLHEKELFEESSQRCGPDAEPDKYEFPEGQTGASDEGGVIKDSHDKCASPKMCDQSIDEFQEEQSVTVGVMSKGGFGGEGQQHYDVEVKDGSELSSQLKTLNGTPLERTANHISANHSKCNSEHEAQVQSPNPKILDEPHKNIIADQGQSDMGHCLEAETLSDSDGYREENINCSMKKHDFLRSQSLNFNSSLPAELTEQSLCMKCNEGGQLLACNNNKCPLVVHQKCLGSPFCFNSKGVFYCPFCAYSLALSEYLEAKKQASLAKKELAAFVNLGLENQTKDLTKGLHGKEKNQAGQNGDEDLVKSHGDEHFGTGEESQLNQHDQDKEYVNGVHNFISPKSTENAKETVPNASFNTVDSQHRRSEVILNGNSLCQSVVGTERAEQLEAAENRGDDNISSKSKDNKNFLGNHGQAEAGKQLDVPVYALNNDAKESSEEDDDDKSIVSDYSIRFRRRYHYTYPATPQLRRKKVPWTAEEEQMLKDGVQKFSSPDERNIPWKKILEFGASVFLKDRTTIDLKDKWRNLCKSPKSK